MESPTTTVPQTNLQGGPEVPVETEYIYIRIRNALLCPIPSGTTNALPADPDAHGHLYLIEGKYQDIQRYAGTTVDWIIKVAHLICDPLGEGQVYTHTMGTPSEWYFLDRTPDWRQVAQGDPLIPGIYEFESSTGPILLSKISERQTHSVTTAGSESSATTFLRHISLREGERCGVTRVSNSLIASHLIPKRMGSDGARDAIERFSGPQAALGIHSFDPRIGILLNSNLDSLVDFYKLGFYHIMDDTYALHNFDTDHPDLTVLGVDRVPFLNLGSVPDLHLYPVMLEAHSTVAALPPTGAFNWHYLQCVIHVLGTPQYKNFPNIKYFVYPFKTADEISENEYEDNDDTDPPYPSYRFDRYLAEQGRKQIALERHEEMVQWASKVSSDMGADI